MLRKQKYFRLNFVLIALLLLVNVVAFGGDSGHGIIDATAEFLGLRSSNVAVATSPSTGESLGTNVPVALPMLNAAPGPVTIPITVSTDVSALGIISYDLNIDFNSTVLTPASPAFDVAGTMSSAMAITPNS